MGFLNRTVFAKRLNKTNLFVLAIIAGVISCGLAISPSTFAEEVVDNYGLYTDSDGVRWEWEVVSDSENTAEPQKINLMFYDKPENLTTVTVPSYTDMTTITGVTPTSDTYYVRSANQESQDTRFTNPDPARRTANQADVTVLDMTNTSKVQILGVKPIINPETEVELIFGENMVIGDGLKVHLTEVWVYRCVGWSDYYIDEEYYHLCADLESETIQNPETRINGWREKSFEEQLQYQVTAEDLGFIQPQQTAMYWVNWNSYERGIVPDSDFDPSLPYVHGVYGGYSYSEREIEEGAFSGYKLKLTNFSGFNYVGWHAFANSIFNESNSVMTIDGDAFVGEDIFAGTNVKKAIVNTDSVGTGLFRNCSELTEVVFGQNVTKVGYYNFAGTNLGSFDFSNTNIKTILRSAFDDAHLTEVNLDGVEKLDYEAFANNDLSALVLPKSIRDLNSARIFAGNSNLIELTVAYDTLTTGTRTPLHAAIGEWVNDDGNVANNIKKLTILAPYGKNEAVSNTHITYEEYPTNFGKSDAGDLSEMAVYLASEDAEADKYKNVIAKGYFAYFGGVEDLIIGDGYEYVGAQAFYNYLYGPYRYNTNYYFDYSEDSLINKKFHVSLPETLKGIGGGAFASHYDNDFAINLPQSLEFIGNRAFYNDYLMRVDVDLPNLRYIGSHAFFTTGIRNLYLHDKLEWVGSRPFQGCWNLHDITFDYDVFGQDSHLFSTYNGYGNFSSSLFGHPITGYPVCGGTCNGYYEDENEIGVTGWGHNGHKLSTVTFTAKASTSPMIQRVHNEYDGGYTSGIDGPWFYDIVAEKIDLSKTGWSELSGGAFQFSAIDEVVLPENLEKIWGAAFYGSRIKNELVLPDTLTFIASDAFSNQTSLEYDGIYYDGQNYYNKNDEMLEREGFETRRYLTPEDHEPCEMREGQWSSEIEYYGPGCFRDGWDGRYYYRDPFGYTRGVKITTLPDSLEYIGIGAFYGDDRFESDIDLPNLKTIGRAAFNRSAVGNVKLGENIETLGRYAFVNAYNLEDIEIDFDIIALFYTDSHYPQYGGEVEYSGDISFRTVFGINDSEMQGIKMKNIIFGEHAITPPLVLGREFVKEYGHYNVINPDDPSDEWIWVNEPYEWIDEYREYYKGGLTSFFYGAEVESIDLSRAQWDSIPANIFNQVAAKTIKLPAGITSIPDYAFYGATVENPVEIPAGVTTIGTEAFQYSNISFSNALPEGVIVIGPSAFYSADIHGDFTIPSTVAEIGWSAFNASEVDTHYDTVTIKPDLNYGTTSNQAVFQIFWNAKMNKLVIESPMLPVLRASIEGQPILPEDIYDSNSNLIAPGHTLREDGEPEFHGMTMREVVIKNLYAITPNAFEECAELEKVVVSENQYLDRIGKYAFNNATKLKQVVFGEANNNHEIHIEEYAFNNTAIESLGITDNAGVNLAAADFYTDNEHVFSNMPKLKSVDIPNNFNIDENLVDEKKNFNGSYITSFTFADDPELENVTIGYQVAEIRDGAFLNDEKLTKLFIWGNTDIQESDDLICDFNNTTIPHATNIFAYSDALAENYANDDSRSAYDGKFYPLDEVLYLTSNKTYVILEQDEEGNNVDFDKDGLILYALRRDGVILESDDWQTYTKAYPRATAPNIVFEEGKGAAGNLGTDEELMWTVYDAPKPFDTISLANQNYGETNFEFIQMPSSANPLVAIHYPDGYTAAIRTTTLASMTQEEEEEMLRELEVPNTGAFQTIASIAAPSVSIATIVVLGGIYVARKRKN